MNPAALAYPNYMYFDTDMALVSSGFAGVTAAARGTGAHEALGIKGFVATTPGRLLVYLSNVNDKPLPVHFDDLTITHRTAPGVVQSDDYYPFGLTFNSYGKGLGPNSIIKSVKYHMSTGSQSFQMTSLPDFLSISAISSVDLSSEISNCSKDCFSTA